MEENDVFQAFAHTPAFVKLQDLTQQADNVVNEWKMNLAIGDLCDVYEDCNWSFGKVIGIPEEGIIHVHFQGWGNRFDKDVELSKSHVYPAQTFSKPRATGCKKRKNDPGAAVADSEPKKAVDDAKIYVPGVGYVDQVPFIETQSRTGRIIKSKLPLIEPRAKKTKSSTKSQKSTEGGDAADHNDFLCATCNLFEADNHSDLILCDGPCLQSWHLGCMGVGRDSVIILKHFFPIFILFFYSHEIKS